ITATSNVSGPKKSAVAAKSSTGRSRRPSSCATSSTDRGLAALTSGDVEPVQVHHLRPRSDEIGDELGLRIGGGVDLGHGAQLRVRAEDEIDARAGPPQLAALAVATLERAFVARCRLPLGLHVEQVDEEVVAE